VRGKEEEKEEEEGRNRRRRIYFVLHMDCPMCGDNNENLYNLILREIYTIICNSNNNNNNKIAVAK